MSPYVLVLLAYVVGATPTSFWIGRYAYGVDLREMGSGNLGATNTFRILGWKAALPVVVVDVAKGWLPVFLFPQLDGSAGWSWALAYGAAAILGHVFSFWVGFRGGKGVATSGGVFLALVPKAVLAAVIVWVLVVSFGRIVSLGSLAAAVTIPVAVSYYGHPGGSSMVWFTVALALFVFWAHRSNIRRLLQGREPRIRPGRGPMASGEGAAAAEASNQGGSP